MKTYLQIGLLCLACSAGAQGTSEEAVFNFSSTISGYIEGTGGWTFKPKAPIAIGQLGAFTNIVVDQGAINVGVWSSSGTLLRSAVVNSSSELINRSYYSTVEPIWLVPLETYHLGVFSASGRVYMNIFDPLSAPGDSVSLSSLILLGGLAEGPGFSFPAAVVQGEGAMWLGPNVVFVPEPSSMALIGFGAGFFFLRRLFPSGK